MTDEKFAELFASDVAAHVMKIVKDDGFYRHLEFRDANSPYAWFDIISWPGNLTIKGDMGCYTFSRIDDMFEFFREPEPNYYYWTQKCIGIDRNTKIKEFSEKLFREAVKRDLDDFDADAEFRAEVEDIVGDMDFMDPRACVSEIIAVEHDGRHPFADFWEHNLKSLTYGFRWCLHAIHWAIKTYDSANVAKEATT